MEQRPEYLKETHIGQKIVLTGLAIIGLILASLGGLTLSSHSQTLSPSSPIPKFDPKKTITVDVQGAVKHPGVQSYSISFGESVRIHELLEKAGGFTQNADQAFISKQVNLATTVADGYKLYIPSEGETVPSQAQTLGVSSTGGVNVNTSSKEDLLSLKGIGEARAMKIMENRPYGSIQELSKKASVPLSVLEPIQADLSF